MKDDMFENGDLLRIEALLARYAWCLDTGDIDGVMATFEPDAVFQDTAGNEYRTPQAIRGYFDALTALPAFRGRQHHIDALKLEPAADGYAGRSYWHITKWRAEDGQKLVEGTGHSFDRFRRTAAGLRFAERRVYHWRDADCPWHPAGTAV